MSTDPARKSIRWYGAAVLRRPTEPLEPGTAETARLLDELWHVLEAGGGVGLAAPQIGVAARAFVMRDPEKPGAEGRVDVVNPVLVREYGADAVFEEGCLSFPGMYFDVVRRQGAEIEYRDAQGLEQRLQDDGLPARIARHELDHLEGILFIDRVPAWRRALLLPRLSWVLAAGMLVGRWKSR